MKGLKPTSSISTSPARTVRRLLSFVTLTILVIWGIWELFQDEAHRPHLLLILVALFLSGLAVLTGQLLRDRVALEEARVSHSRLRLALSAGNSVAWDLNVKTGEGQWFGDLKTMFGIPGDTLTVQRGDFYRYVHPDERQRVSEAIAQAQATRSTYVCEFRMVHEDGTIRWVSATGEFRYTRKGEAVRMLGIATDITDRRKAHETLVASEEKFSKTFGSSPIPMALTRVSDRRFLDVNAAWERYTGWNRDEAIGKTPMDLNLWVTPSERDQAIKHLLAHKSMDPIEFWFRRKDGEHRVGLGSGELIEIEGELCTLVSTVDMTDRRTAEKALRASEEKFSKAFRESPVALTLTTVGDHRYIDINETFERATGWSRSEVIGRTPADINLWADPAGRDRFVRQVLEKRTIRNLEVPFRRKDGQVGVGLASAELMEVDDEPCILSAIVDITDRKHTEDALRIKEAELAEAQSLAHLGNWELTFEAESDIPGGRFNLKWSKEVYRIHGIDPSLPPPQSLSEIFTPKSLQDFYGAIQCALKTGTVTDLDLEVVRPDGSTRWVNSHGELRRDSFGKIKGFLGTSQDITDRKRAENDLQRKEHDLAEAQRLGHIGSWECEADGSNMHWSEELFRIYGLDPAQAAPSFDELQKLYTPETWNRMLQVMEARSFHDLDMELVRPDGTRRWIRTRFDVAREPDGTVVKFRGISRDVTDEKKTADQLRESEERFRLVSNTAPVMIWLCGCDNQCTYVNRRWLEFTGRSLEQELGEGWLESVHPEDVQECVEKSREAFGQKITAEVQYRLRRHDGQYRWILDIGVPRLNPDGSFAGYIGSCIDITERKQAEETMATIGRRLIEAHEEERTRIGRELHDDINQRLALLAVELDRWTEKQSSSPELLQLVSHAQQRITDIAKDVQSLSHRLHSSKLDYLGLATAANSFCRELSESSNVHINFTHAGLPRTLPKEVSLCLFRVLQEALQNAVKHSGVNRFTVHLRGMPDVLELTVTDSGLGFEEQEVFTRRGLGLISMRERLQLVHGELSIQSHRGAGTTILARVPVNRRELQATG